MENTDNKNFVSHNPDKPFIRTMADDLKKIKNGSAIKKGEAFNTTPSSSVFSKPNTPFGEIKYPNLSSVSVPIPNKTNISADDPVPVSAKTSVSAASKKILEDLSNIKKAEQIRREKEKIEQEIIKKEQEIITQAEMDKKLAIVRKNDEELKLKKEKFEKETVQKEKERLIQVETERELEIKRKEEIRLEKEKAERLRLEKEKIEQARLEKEKIEKGRIRKELEMIEQAKKEEAMKIKKKLSEEIKKEMEEEIAKEKEKAEQIKTEMELEIKKEMEAAEAIKKERENAMKKRVAKVIKDEMEEEIAKEKEKAEQIKREVEIEIKRETEEELEKEKQLEKEIKKEMAIDMRKEIAERHKKNKEAEESKNPSDSFNKGNEEPELATQEEIGASSLKTKVSFKTAQPIAKSFSTTENLSISQAAAMDRLRLNKIQIDEENKKAEQLLREDALAIANEREERIRLEKEKAERLRLEKEKIEQARLQRDKAEMARAEKEKQRLAQIEAEKKTDAVYSRKGDINSDLKRLNKGLFGRSNSFGREFAEENKKEIITLPVSPLKEAMSKSITPVSESMFAKKPQGVGYLMDDIQNLSPEARLARQTSLGNIDSEYRENLIIPPSAKIIPGVQEQADKIVQPSKIEKFMPHPENFKKKSVEEIINEENSSSFLGKLIKLIIIVLVFVGIAAGTYYFYVSRKAEVNHFSVSVPSEAYISNVTETFISVDPSADINSEIKLFFSNQPSSGIFRLIVKEKDGQNSLGLENFRNSLNINLPDYITGALEKDYNLMVFNYPEKNYLRLGLIFKSNNSADISAVVKNWEVNMYQDVKPIFIDNSGTYEKGKSFGNNRYGDFDIKYLPLGAENIGLNYAIDSEKKFLLITTSKDDIYILIDKIIKGN